MIGGRGRGMVLLRYCSYCRCHMAAQLPPARLSERGKTFNGGQAATQCDTTHARTRSG